MKKLTLLASVAAALGLAFPAFAGTVAKDFKSDKKVMQEPCPPDALTLIHTDSDYVWRSSVDRGDGTQDALHNSIVLGQRIPLGGIFGGWPNAECGHWYLRLGAAYERFDFGTDNETRLPDTLQSIAGVIAVEYVVKNDAAILLESRPGVYFQHDINTGAFDAPTTLAAAIPVFGGDKFYLVLGAYGSLLGNYPVVPFIGAIWHINDQWDLRAVLPEPRLTYKVTEKLHFYVGGELAGGGFKTDRRFVQGGQREGRGDVSGTTVTYTDVRAGGGITWEGKPFTVELGGGASLQRQFDYSRADESFETDPAPYVKLTVKAEF